VVGDEISMQQRGGGLSPRRNNYSLGMAETAATMDSCDKRKRQSQENLNVTAFVANRPVELQQKQAEWLQTPQ
jgi:hypothetical protein